MSLFSSNKNIIYLTRNKLWFIDHSTKEKTKLSLDWDGRDAKAVLAEYKKRSHASDLKIILGNDISYVLNIQIPVAKSNQEEIQRISNELIPEDISNENMSWKAMGKPESNMSAVQIISAPKSILQTVSDSATVNQIKIESFCPVAILLAQSIPNKIGPSLVVWSGEEKLAVVVKQNIIYASKTIDKNPPTEIQALLDFAKDKYGLDIIEAFLHWPQDSAVLPATIKGQKLDFDLFDCMEKSYTQEKEKDSGLQILKPLVVEAKEDKKVETTTFSAEPKDGQSKPVQTIGAASPPKSEKKSSPFLAIILVAVIVLSLAYIVWKFLQ